MTEHEVRCSHLRSVLGDAALASHPAPTTGAGISDVWIEAEGAAREAFERALERREPTTNALSEGIRAGLRVLSPTPPPGLLEAVGKLAWVWRETMRRHGRGMLAFPATYGEMETLLAAYDAAKGGETQTLGTARVVECLKRRLDEAYRNEGTARELGLDRMSAHHGGARDMAQAIVQDLGLTLATPPSGPGGGEVDESARCVGCSLTEGHFAECPFGRRARTATTPTPEVPSQPSTPAVVWEDSDVQVFADGTAMLLRPHPLEPLAPSRASEHILAPALERVARALAEAKREAENLRSDVQRQIQVQRIMSETGLGIEKRYSAKEMGAHAARAAESMRERAAKECDETANDAEVPAHTREVARLLAKCIRALPLE